MKKEKKLKMFKTINILFSMLVLLVVSQFVPVRASAVELIVPENNQSRCSDTIDNDGDTLIDTDDPDCYPTLLIRKEVIRSLALPGQFTIKVTHPDNSTEDIDGSTAGVEVIFESTGSFLVTEDPPEGFTVSYLGECSGEIDASDYGTRIGTCVVRNDGGDDGGEEPTPEDLVTEGSCTDGIDNDQDGFIDSEDPGCQSESPADVCPNIDGNQETVPEGYELNDQNQCVLIDEGGGGNGSGPTPEDKNTGNSCSDGIDNDQDGKTDSEDSGCQNSSGGGGGGSGSKPKNVSTGLVLGASTLSCEPYLRSYLRMGMQNDSSEVMKLQSFLNEQGIKVPVTGYFGLLTDAAVRAFQSRYSTEVLQPWANIGLGGETTGYVYKTTQFKINDIVCRGSQPFPTLP